MKTLTHCLNGTPKQQPKPSLFLAFAGFMALSGGHVSAETAEAVGDPLDPFAPSLFDAKTYHGVECNYIDILNENSPDYYNNPVKYDTHGIFNQDATYTHVVCPIVRDNTTNTNGTLGAEVFVNNVGPKELWCKLLSRDHYGSLMDEDMDSTTSGGNRTLSLDVDISASLGNYSIYCRFPEGARIYSYRVTEFQRTDWNN